MTAPGVGAFLSQEEFQKLDREMAEQEAEGGDGGDVAGGAR